METFSRGKRKEKWFLKKKKTVERKWKSINIQNGVKVELIDVSSGKINMFTPPIYIHFFPPKSQHIIKLFMKTPGWFQEASKREDIHLQPVVLGHSVPLFSTFNDGCLSLWEMAKHWDINIMTFFSSSEGKKRGKKCH